MMMIKATAKYVVITSAALLLFTFSILLEAQAIENVPVTTSTPKSYIGASAVAIMPNSNYGEDNIGVDVFFRHRFNKTYYCVNANYINYKNDSVTKEDYLVTLGSLYISEPIIGKDSILAISYCYGVDFGVLYKDNDLCGAVNINMGFIWKVYKNLNFEFMVKTKANKFDKVHTGMTVGLSYQF